MVSSMRELTYKTLDSLAKLLRYICVAGKKVVTIEAKTYYYGR